MHCLVSKSQILIKKKLLNQPGFDPRPPYDCQCCFIQSEALLILSFSFRKGESNAAFPVSIGLQVWIIQALLSCCMARANGKCHVPFRGHPDIDSTTFSSFPCVEHRRSGPNPFSRSSIRSKKVKIRATCQWHVAPGTENDAIDLAIFQLLNLVE